MSTRPEWGPTPRDRPFPRTVRQAFDRYLDAVPSSAAARDLLLPLAYAFGDGLPADEVWLTAVEALRRRCAQADLDDLLAGPAGSFLVVRSDARDRRHRLFHHALGETLTAGRDATSDQGRLWNAWVAALPSGPGGDRPEDLGSHHRRADG